MTTTPTAPKSYLLETSILIHTLFSLKRPAKTTPMNDILIGTPTQRQARAYDLDIPDLLDQGGIMDLKVMRTVYLLTPLEIGQLTDAAGTLITDAFKTATSESKRIVRQYAKTDLRDEIIVISGRCVEEGYHRAMAALVSKQNLHCLNLAET
jgi:hypothetical protein